MTVQQICSLMSSLDAMYVTCVRRKAGSNSRYREERREGLIPVL